MRPTHAGDVAEPLAQVIAMHVFEHQHVRAPDLTEVDDGDDVGMLQVRDDARFSSDELFALRFPTERAEPGAGCI